MMSDDQTARLGLPYLAAGQMQKHVTLNEALTRLDALVQTTVASRSVASQPSAPADGLLYILPDDPGGPIWADFTGGDLVRAETGGWEKVPVIEGQLVWIADEAAFVVRADDGWVPLGEGIGEVGPLDRLGIGTSPDADNPFAAKLNKALWTARDVSAGGDGDLRFTLNKEAPTDVLSLLFQSGYAGRAELGLIGDDALTLKVSEDGEVWRSAFSVDSSSGRMAFPQGSVRRETTVFTAGESWTPPAWARIVEAVVVAGGGGGGAGAFGPSGSRYGGGGAGAGGVSRAIWPAEQVSAGLTVVVGAGGPGGVAGAGAAGGNSAISLGSVVLLLAMGGGAGGPGTASSGAAGAGGAGLPNSNSGGASSLIAVAGAGKILDRPDASGGGGAGGGLDASGVARAGGAGGDGGALAVKATGGAGGSGTVGMPGLFAPVASLHWAGGGGGGGGASASGAGHAGADGGGLGGGGGGGGAAITAGGGGGAGGAGVVWLTAQG